jgi:nucleoid-associated protein YgaU
VLAGAIVVYFLLAGAPTKPTGEGETGVLSTPQDNTVVQVLPDEKPAETSELANDGILVPAYDGQSQTAEPTTKGAQDEPFDPAAIEIKAEGASADEQGGEQEMPVVVPLSLPVAENKPAPAAAPPTTRIYTVTASDTGGFFDIAKKHYGSIRYVYLIQQANPGVDPTRLRVGQRLVMPPKPSGEPSTPSSVGGEIYIVQKDDRLWDIAKAKYGRGEDWHLIRRANPGIDPDKLHAGQRLLIPPKPASDAAATTTLSDGRRLYKVKEGDSFWLIAQRELGDGRFMDKLKAVNPSVDAGTLRVGQMLVLPVITEADRKALVASGSTAATKPAAAGAQESDGRPVFD